MCFRQFLRHLQQLIILILQFLLRMHLPYPRHQYLNLLLLKRRKPIKHMILLLPKNLRLKPPKQLRRILILLYPSQHPKSHIPYSESYKFWSLFKSACENIVCAYFSSNCISGKGWFVKKAKPLTTDLNIKIKSANFSIFTDYRSKTLNKTE